MTVFVSYARKDKQVATALAEDLEGLVGSVWLDQILSGGQRWWDEILHQIRGCRLFVLAVSKNSAASVACLAESGYALQLDRPFLAVCVGTVNVLSLPEAVRKLQTIDYAPNDNESLKALARAVIHAPPPGPLPADLPPDPPVPESYKNRFAQLYAPEPLSVSDQVSAFARLKLDIENDENADEATELLHELLKRKDVAYAVHRDVTAFLGGLPDRASGSEGTTGTPAEPTATERAETTGPSRTSRTAVASGSPGTPGPSQASGAPATSAAASPPDPPDPSMPVPGWYPDPTHRFELRYWNGRSWTGDVTRQGQRFVDRLPGT